MTQKNFSTEVTGQTEQTGKTLNELASKFNLYTYENMSEEYKYIYNNNMSDYNKEIKVNIPSILIDNPLYEVGIYFECKTQDKGTEKEYKYIQHQSTLIKRKDTNIIFMLRDAYKNKDKFTICLYYSYYSEYSKISYYKRDEALKGLKEPNAIGVFTEKKINDWIEYNLKYDECMQTLKAEVNNKNEENKKKILEFIENLKGKVKVSERKEDNKIFYYVETSLFYVTFIQYLDSHYSSQEIRYKGNLNDIIDITEKL